MDESEKKKAEEIIELRDREKSKQSNFRNLWQDTADLMYTLENRITNTQTSGGEKTTHLRDTTASTESFNMTSGLISQIIPPGQEFYGLRASDRKMNEDKAVERYFSMLTEGTHEEMFNSNFLLELSLTIHSLIVFGMGNLYADWEFGPGLYYRDYPIGRYQILESEQGVPDTMILSIPKTARQAVQKFGEENVGKNVLKAFNEPKDANNIFDFIHLVRPRKKRTRGMIDFLNMPFESFYVGEQDVNIVDEGGYPEFPFSVARWLKSSGEVYGRGVGTEILPQVRILNRMVRDKMEVGNKWANSPKEVLESFDGKVDVTPGALNFVTQIPSIKAIDEGARGSYPICKEEVEEQRNIIKEAFFKNVFEQLAELTGDRRTTLEIIERLKEGLKKLSTPIGRLFSELFNRTIPRTTLLLIRNGVLPQPPPQLRGKGFKVEYTGPLALALKDQHIRAFDFWIDLVGRMEEVFPGTRDNVDSDEAVRDIGQFLGVKTDHIRGIRERDEIRIERQREQEKQKQLEMAAIAAQAYGQTTKTPEPGSGAESLQEAMK